MPTSAQLLDLALLGKRREIRLLRTDTEYEISDTDISAFVHHLRIPERGFLTADFDERNASVVRRGLLSRGSVSVICAIAHRSYAGWRLGKRWTPENLCHTLTQHAATDRAHFSQREYEAWFPCESSVSDLLLRTIIAATSVTCPSHLKDNGVVQETGSGSSVETLLCDEPPSVDELAAFSTMLARRLQSYTAARMVLTAAKAEHRSWLSALAVEMSLDTQIRDQVDALLFGSMPEKKQKVHFG